MTLMTGYEAVMLLESMVRSHNHNFDQIESFLQHSNETGRIAREVAEKLGLEPQEMALAGYFHDIGRCFTEDATGHAFHEIIGAQYIEDKGVKIGVSDSPEVCSRIAQAFRSHFVVYEQFAMQEYAQWLDLVRDTDRRLLLPSSWNEYVIVYADLTNVNGNRCSFQERLSDIRERAEKIGSPRVKALDIAEPRLFDIEKRVEQALAKGLAVDAGRAEGYSDSNSPPQAQMS